MLTIDRLKLNLRLTARPAERAALARRIASLLSDRLAEALDPLTRDLPGQDGPHIIVRRLDLRLFLSGAADLVSGAALSEAQLAETWAQALMGGLHRILALGSTEDVARFSSRSDFLALWAGLRITGSTSQDWRFQEFHDFDDLPAGQAISVALSREPVEVLRPTLSLVAQQGHRHAALLASFTAPDVARLWQALTGALPRPGRLSADDLAAAAMFTVPAHALTQPLDSDDRARSALARLIALLSAANPLPPRRAGAAALTLTAIEAICRAEPDAARQIQTALAHGDTARAATLLAALPMTLQAPAEAVLPLTQTPQTRSILIELLTTALPEAKPSPAQPRSAPTVLPSLFAGTALLIPVLAQMSFAAALGPAGRRSLLLHALPPALRPLASEDQVIRALCGIPNPPEPAPHWPMASDLALDPTRLADTEASHGASPQTPALQAVLTRFAKSMRGMETSSAAYLAQQFLVRPGRLIHGPDGPYRLMLDAMPLGMMLRMSGALGLQRPVPWLAPRALIFEVTDA